jgi:hypothetical protein
VFRQRVQHFVTTAQAAYYAGTCHEDAGGATGAP